MTTSTTGEAAHRPEQTSLHSQPDSVSPGEGAPTTAAESISTSLRRYFAGFIGEGLASRVISTSAVTFILGGAVWQWQTGYDNGVADRRGIAVEYLHGGSDVGATPFEAIFLMVVASFLLAAVGLLLPALTSWHIPGILGVVEIVLGLFKLLGHDPLRWVQLLIGASLCVFAVIVEVAARSIGRLRRHWRDLRVDPERARRISHWIGRHMTLRLPESVDRVVTFVAIVFVMSAVAALPLIGANEFGEWFGARSAAPDQALTVGGMTYLWLGTTGDGHVVGRLADVCGSADPASARRVAISGTRSSVLSLDDAIVIRLRPDLRVVRSCS